MQHPILEFLSVYFETHKHWWGCFPPPSLPVTWDGALHQPLSLEVAVSTLRFADVRNYCFRRLVPPSPTFD